MRGLGSVFGGHVRRMPRTASSRASSTCSNRAEKLLSKPLKPLSMTSARPLWKMRRFERRAVLEWSAPARADSIHSRNVRCASRRGGARSRATSKVTLIAVLSAMGCALLIDDIEDLILGSVDDNPPREGGTAAARPRPDPTTTAPPTTAVPFDPENDGDTWFAGIRACITIDKEDGMATITYD